MLNTVPKGVQLTEVIEPLPVKPSNVGIILAGDTLQLSGELRVCAASPTTYPRAHIIESVVQQEGYRRASARAVGRPRRGHE